jgi:hypothetical protein
MALLLLPCGADPALASTFERAIEHCRDAVGLPIVQACLSGRGNGAEFEACRARASPAVRACVQKTMLATRGRADLQQAIVHCRQTVGRPLVQTCMNTQGKGPELEECRKDATPRVRACVRERMIAAYGRAKFEQAIARCRQTVGRPIVRACMGAGRAGADLETCRSKASPRVRACVQRRMRTARRLSAIIGARLADACCSHGRGPIR